MPIFVTAGTRFYIGTVRTGYGAGPDYAEADFSGETWIEVGNLEAIGAIRTDTSADAYTYQDVDDPNSAYTFRMKGTVDAGFMELVAGLDSADAGQLSLISASRIRENVAFRILFSDRPASGVSPQPSKRFFVGFVDGVSEVLDQANNVVKLTARIAINSNIVRVAATAG